MMGCPKGLGSVFNDRKMVLGRDRVDCRHVRCLTIDADRHDGLGLVSDGRFDLSRIHVPRRFINVDKDWLGPDEGDHFRCGNPSVGNGDHFIPGPDSEGHQSDEQRVRPARSTNAMVHTDIVGKSGLKFANLRAEDVLAVIQDSGDSTIEFPAYSRLLSFEIDELHRPSSTEGLVASG